MLKKNAILPYMEYDKYYIMIFPTNESSFLFQVVSKEIELRLIYQTEEIPIEKLEKILEEEYFIFPTNPQIKIRCSDIKSLIKAYLKD
ncbi:MAG: hypothetical protein QW156_00730 [Candidatus Aenigmatarchaeota archaeon]